MRPGTGTCILPFGPWTSMASAAICTFTPAGIGIGFLPIRDMALPNLAQEFAAHAFFAGGLAGHDSARRGKNGNAHAANDRANAGLADVAAAAGARNALQIRQHAALVAGVAEKHAQDFLLVLVHHFVGGNVALFLQDTRDFDFHLRRWQIDARMARADGITNPREHVSNRVGGHLSSLPNFAGRHFSYQLALVTPGISPLSASPRKQMRHISNFRKNARDLPQMRQRLRTRILYFNFFFILAHLAVVAIVCPLAPRLALLRYGRSGTPSSFSNSRPSSSDRADVVSVMFMPLILSTRV